MVPGLGHGRAMEMDSDACYRAVAARDRRFDGRLFVGVNTTGIYCRPFCPAPTPKFQNVRFFPTAAAAQEAGFRPCLRCRPEIAPDLAVVWRGSANTVSRALTLIEMGALDDAAGVEALAERLGVGGRQLRRLFRQHLGASPIAVAQTRRVLLAKQLIQDTRLPMVEVAAAAGFGSVRRFNETFQRLYRRPPGTLRRTDKAKEASTEAGVVAVRLGYRPPYDWDFVVSVLRARAVPGVEAVSAARYARAIGMGSAVVVVEPVPGDCLKATVRLPDLRTLPAIVAAVRRVFDLAADPVAIDFHLSRDAVLAPLVAACPGLRAPGFWDGFEAAVRAILGRHAAADAQRLIGRLAASCGEPVADPAAGELGLAHAFPMPHQLARADLAAAGVPEGPREVMISLATAAAADPLLLGSYSSIEEAVVRLQLLPGMDEQTAQCVAASGLAEPDPLPVAESGLVDAALLAQTARWRPWRAHALLHLWAAGRLTAAPGTEEQAVDQHAA